MEFAGNFLDQYGLWALALGAFFQGYSLVILAGLFVSQNNMNGFDVWIVAAVSAWIGHWFFFCMGRWLGRQRQCITNSKFNNRLNSLETTISDHPWSSIFLIQYGYGLRIAGAIAFGLAKIKRRWFAWAQSLNCILWAVILTGIGYSIGSGIFLLPQKYIRVAAIGITLVFVAVVIFKKKPKVLLQMVDNYPDQGMQKK